jgi:opacity protein-like surface antigen
MRRMFTTALSLLALEGAAHAADLPPAPQLPPDEAQPAWSGFYAGLNVGGAFGSSRDAFNIAGFGLPSFNTSLAGVVGGGEAGYNWQTGPWVLGLEASFEGSGLSGSRTAPCLPPLCGALAASFSQKLPWFGTLRTRVGYAFGNWLLYATGGGALGQVDTNAIAAIGPFIAANDRSQTRTGWTVGGGVEVEIARGWSAKIEYLYVDLGSRAMTYLSSPPIANTSRLSANVIATGVNYHF